MELCAGVSLVESPPVFSPPLVFIFLIILDCHELMSGPGVPVSETEFASSETSSVLRLNPFFTAVGET